MCEDAGTRQRCKQTLVAQLSKTRVDLEKLIANAKKRLQLFPRGPALAERFVGELA